MATRATRGGRSGATGGARRRLARRGELAALVLLVATGHRLRDRNWRAAGGELDLVVERRGEIVFVEVKARTSDLFGGAVQAVDDAKRHALARTAAAYLSRFGLWDRPSRFDVVTFERRAGFPWWRLRHLRDAFRPDLGRRM